MWAVAALGPLQRAEVQVQRLLLLQREGWGAKWLGGLGERGQPLELPDGASRSHVPHMCCCWPIRSGRLGLRKQLMREGEAGMAGAHLLTLKRTRHRCAPARTAALLLLLVRARSMRGARLRCLEVPLLRQGLLYWRQLAGRQEEQAELVLPVVWYVAQPWRLPQCV